MKEEMDMTVGQLIELLKDLPLDFPVVVASLPPEGGTLDDLSTSISLNGGCVQLETTEFAASRKER